MCERIGTKLQFDRARAICCSSFKVKHGSRPISRPKRAAFPAGVRIINPAIDVLGEEPHRVRNGEIHDVPVDDCKKRTVQIAHYDRYVLPQTKGVEPVDPDVIGCLGTPWILHAPHLWTGQLVQRPPFRTMAARCGWAVQHTTLTSIETTDMSAGERRPVHAVSIDIAAAWAVTWQRRLADLGQCGLFGV